MEILRLATRDAIISFFWVFIACTLGALDSIISNHLEIHPPITFFVTTTLVFIHIFIFTAAEIISGACFNPTETVSFYTAGLGNDSLFSIAVRFPAQVVGAMGGAVAINKFMPEAYRHMLDGPSMKVDMQTAAIAEGVLTFVISFLLLLIVLKGPKTSVVQTWLLTAATTVVVMSGLEYSGSSLNPAHAYGWAYLTKQHNTKEHFYVYWIPPLAGSILAAWFIRLLFSPPKQKVKEA